MPAPVNAEEFLELVRKSGVVEDAKLRAYVKRLTDRSALPSEPAKLAGQLVRDAVLTYFQAEQLLQGKYKRFTIGKYKVLEKLGAGGMGQVFLCEHKLMRRRVAVKVLPTAKAEDRASLDRFYREARAVAAVDHPNIVRAYDIDQDENLHFLVMEYVDGTNLQDLVKKVGPLDPVRACHYVYGASVGLQHAHEIGLVHRDIKPGNILIDRSGVVKILDMGLARFFHDEDDNLTRQNDENVLGTADYLAPEQALDSHTVDIRADIYSLGATFYYLLTSSPPFPDGSVAQKLIWHQNRQPRHVRSLRSDVPDEIIAIVDRMMMKDPAKRYQTPSDVMAALARWVATPIPPPSERELPTVSPAAGGGRAPATMVGAARGSVPGDAPTVIAPTPAPVVTPPPLGPLDANTPAPVVWETLDSETQPLSRGDTDRPGQEHTPRPTRTPATPARKRVWLYAAVASGLLAVAVAAYLIVRDKPQPPGGPAGSPSHVPQQIKVSKAGGESTVPTLREALTRAGPGDTILIVEPRLVEPKLTLDRQKHKDLTIESATADGRPAVVEASGTFGAMFDAPSVEGLKLRNVEFDGRGVVEVGVQISGTAPATSVEGVTVRGVKTACFRLSNVAGQPAHPVGVRRCRAVLAGGTQTGVWVFAANADTRSAEIQNVRVEGAGGGVGVRLEGACSDVVITGCRLFNLDTALFFDRPPTDRVVDAKVVANTVYKAATGLLFHRPTPLPKGPKEPPPGKFNLTVERNYFAQTKAIATTQAGPLQGVTSADNAQGPGAAPGNFAITARSLPSPVLPSPEPDEDATFLRFATGQPSLPPKGVKVGAP